MYSQKMSNAESKIYEKFEINHDTIYEKFIK